MKVNIVILIAVRNKRWWLKGEELRKANEASLFKYVVMSEDLVFKYSSCELW